MSSETIAYFEKVYCTSFSDVTRMAVCGCGQLEDVPEIVRQTYAEVYRRICNGKRDVWDAAVLTSLCRTACSRVNRLRRRHPVCPAASVGQTAPQPQRSYASCTSDKVRIMAIWRDIQALPPETAKCLVLYSGYGLECPVVGQALGLTPEQAAIGVEQGLAVLQRYAAVSEGGREEKRDFLRKVIEDNLVDLKQVKRSVIDGAEGTAAWHVEPETVKNEKEASGPRRLRPFLLAAGCLIVLIAAVLLFWQGLPHAGPGSSPVPSDQTGFGQSVPAVEPKTLEKDRNGYWILPNGRVTPLAYMGPDIPAVLAGEPAAAVEDSIRLDLAPFGLDSEVTIPVIRMGGSVYPYGTVGNYGPDLTRSRSRTVLFTVTGSLEWCDTLFSYNLDTGEIVQRSRYRTDGYDAEELNELAQEQAALLMDAVPALAWLGYPLVNEESTLGCYRSNRRTCGDFMRRWIRAQKGQRDEFPSGTDLENDIWMVDLETGEESLLVEDASALYWAGRHLVYQSDRDGTIWTIQADTKVKTRLFTQDPEAIIISDLGHRLFLAVKRPNGELNGSGWGIVDAETGFWRGLSVQVAGRILWNSPLYDTETGTMVYLFETAPDPPKLDQKETSVKKAILNYAAVIDAEGRKTCYVLPDVFQSEWMDLRVAAILDETRIVICNRATMQYAVVDLSHEA